MRDRQATTERPARRRAAAPRSPAKPSGLAKPGTATSGKAALRRPARPAAGKPRRSWTNLGPLVVAVVLVLIAGAWATVTYSPLLDARSVSVRGTQVLTAAQVNDVAKVPVGTPLARVDLGAIEQRVAAIPRVASVTVSRDWPHTVRIQVTERQVAIVIPDSGRFVEVDKTGVRFGTVDAAPQGVPVVTADPATVSSQTLAGVVEVIGTLPAAVAPRVRDITARTRDDIVLTLDDGVVVMWGGAENSPRKAEVLMALMKLDAKVYDVSVPEAPATRNAPL
ncbi:cell division protein FtsQ/DivIB [Yinghuangia sp. YIM S10712]|uniref:cell division protein FtsQ/DivIB n=1 Tax=Yinghuangia sp. YIM S10712 TaxID=3436930 RepID=UPI003F52EB03